MASDYNVQREGAEEAQGGLRRWHLYLIISCWTMFGVFLYSRFSTLGDSESYLSGKYDEEDNHGLRTIVITKLAEFVHAVVHVDLLAQLVFGAFAATGLWMLVKHARLHGRYRWPLVALLVNPNFGTWASVIGRESLFVGLMGFFLGAVLGYWRRPGFLYFLLATVCVGLMIFIRAPYGASMAVFFVMFLIYRSGPRVGLSVGVQTLLLLGCATLILLVVWHPLDDYITEDVLPRARAYFSLASGTTRTWIDMETTSALLKSLWWSLPLALVGPTPAEVLARPIMAPFMLSGLVVFGTLLYSIGMAFRAPKGLERKILLLGWFPALVMILIAYVPFGIYNSGSAIRYASCFLPYVIFPSMLLSAAAAAARDERRLAEEDGPVFDFVAHVGGAGGPVPSMQASLERIR
jgi:hypothetical protein